MYSCKFTLVFSYQNNQPQKSGGQPANLNPHKIVAGICAVAPPIQMGFSLDEHSSNHPGAAVVSHMPIDREPTTGAWSYHVGHWYGLNVPSSGLGQTQIIVQQVEDMRQSVEKMVRIKQTLIESKQTEGGNNQQHQSD